MSKAVDFSATALGKAVSVVIKGLIVLGLIALVVWSIYVTIIKPHTNPTPTQEQNAKTIQNDNYTIKVGFGGCARFPIRPDKK